MSFLETIKSGIKNHFDKQREDRELIEKVRFEAQTERLKIFEEEMRKNSFEVAKAQAKRDAAKLSGLQKLRATNRLRNLNQGEKAPGSFLGKLSEYTQRNIAKREENLKKTAEMRKVAEELRQKRQQEKSSRIPFQPIRKWQS